MAENPIIHAEGSYTVTNIGPSREFTINGNDGNIVTLVSYSCQFKEVGADWIDVTTTKEKGAPSPGEVMQGHIEDTGKYGMKFKKASKGGFGGGKGFSKGAAFANAVQTASDILGSYASINPEFAKTITGMDVYMKRLEELAPEVKAMVDRLAGEDKEAPVAPVAPAPVQTSLGPDSIVGQQPPEFLAPQGDGDISVSVDTSSVKW